MSASNIVHYGDAALLLHFGETIDAATNRRVHAAAAVVRASRRDGSPWLTVTPAYASLLVEYDPLRVDAAAAAAALEGLLAVAEPLARTSDADATPIEISVSYGGEGGPDLIAVADRCGLTPAQVVEVHTSVVYRAYMLGFAPGFAYLGELPQVLDLPRRDTPRQLVPAGSVAIAGRQTAVYPQATPGGWHIIGRTDAPLWDLERVPPAFIAPGSLVRFVARA